MSCDILLLPFFFFFFNDTATTEIYTLSLHDALPILEMDLLSVGNATAETDMDPATIEFAWRVNQEIMDWTGKVDTKAAIILPFESAIFGLAVSLSSRDHAFAHLEEWRLLLSYGGFAALLRALFFSAMV